VIHLKQQVISIQWVTRRNPDGTGGKKKRGSGEISGMVIPESVVHLGPLSDYSNVRLGDRSRGGHGNQASPEPSELGGTKSKVMAGHFLCKKSTELPSQSQEEVIPK